MRRLSLNKVKYISGSRLIAGMFADENRLISVARSRYQSDRDMVSSERNRTRRILILHTHV